MRSLRGDSDFFSRFVSACVRNMALGTALSIVPAAVFYFFVFTYTPRQFLILGLLGVFDLAFFFPLDVAILRISLAPVRAACLPGATLEDRRRGLARLIDSPRLVLVRVYGPHAVFASAAIALLVTAANRWLGLGIPARLFPLYIVLNLTLIPIAHAVYEFAAMERTIQPVAHILARGIDPGQVSIRRFNLADRMQLFLPLLTVAPIVIVVLTILVRHAAALEAISRDLLGDAVLVGGACSLLFLYLTRTLGRELRMQTGLVTSALDRLGHGDLATRADLYTSSEMGQIAAHVGTMAAELTERQRIRDLFGVYMSNEVAEKLLEKGAAGPTATEKRYIGILFADVRGFTAFARDREPEMVVGVLNEFFAITVEAIAEQGGVVNKYLGDGLLALFGAPNSLANPAGAAIASALEVSRRFEGLNRKWAASDLPQLRIGIGIHVGLVVVGSIGSPKHKLEYTAIGDAVNLGARIEQLNKKLGTEILASEDAFLAAGAEYAGYSIGRFSEMVAGVSEPIVVYGIGEGALGLRAGTQA